MLCCIVEAMPRTEVRTKMIEGAVRRLAINGVEGTSFADVLAATGAPRGSIYHHFPGGKTELLHAALHPASERALAATEATRGKPPAGGGAQLLDLCPVVLKRTKPRPAVALLPV